MKKPDPNNPTSIRLGDLKAPLQQEAMKLDRSLNWLIVSFLEKHPCIPETFKKNKNECSK